MTIRLGLAGRHNTAGMGGGSFEIDDNGAVITPQDYTDNFFNRWMLLEASETAFSDNSEVYRVARAAGPQGEEWTLIGRYRKVSAETRSGYYFGAAVMFSGDCQVDLTVEYLNQLFKSAADFYLDDDVMRSELASRDITRFADRPRARLRRMTRLARQGIQARARQGFAAPSTDSLVSNIQMLVEGGEPGLRNYSVGYIRLNGVRPPENFHVEPPMLDGGNLPSAAPQWSPPPISERKLAAEQDAPPWPTSSHQQHRPMSEPRKPADRRPPPEPRGLADREPVPARAKEADVNYELAQLNAKVARFADADAALREAEHLRRFIQSSALAYLLLCAICAASAALIAYWLVGKFLSSAP